MFHVSNSSCLNHGGIKNLYHTSMLKYILVHHHNKPAIVINHFRHSCKF